MIKVVILINNRVKVCFNWLILKKLSFYRFNDFTEIIGWIGKDYR